MSNAPVEYTNPGPEQHPLRRWNASDEAAIATLRTILTEPRISSAVRKLADQEDLSDGEVAALGIANFQSYLATYEPIAALTFREMALNPVVREVSEAAD